MISNFQKLDVKTGFKEENDNINNNSKTMIIKIRDIYQVKIIFSEIL